MSISLPEGAYDVVGSIVLYRTDPAEIANAIRQFLEVPLKTHLCVIDNSPTPVQLPPCDPARVSYYFANANLGYGRAHNIAVRAAKDRARYNLVMNTDITYEPGTVLRLVDVMDSSPRVGLTGPKVLYPDGTLQYVCRLLPTPANLFLRRFLPWASMTQRADELYELRWWDHASVANIPYFQGSFMLLRTPLCNAIGGFDERFFLYGEDIDLTRRIHQVAQTLYIPDARITHEYRRYSNHSLRGTWHGVLNNCRYFNKWGWFFDRERKIINEQVITTLRSLPMESLALPPG
ncbi:MAG TPA: glycosyltransferase family 2 protein [Steroidobacteraceae bacterium]|nr:glycosyltransferase family 2 protein [Steroidobacteraceae bacterium]